MRQRDLIQWYVSQQNEKNNYDFVEEAAAEISKIKAIIEVNLLFSRTLMLARISYEIDIIAVNGCNAEFNKKRRASDSPR